MICGKAKWHHRESSHSHSHDVDASSEKLRWNVQETSENTGLIVQKSGINSPVEVGSLSYTVLYIPAQVVSRISEPSTWQNYREIFTYIAP